MKFIDNTSGPINQIKIGRGRGSDSNLLGGTIKVFSFERRSANDAELVAMSANVS